MWRLREWQLSIYVRIRIILCGIFPGGKLFSWDNPAEGWDGTFHGKPVKDGVYFLNVDAKGADGRHFRIRKAVNLLRTYNEAAGSGTVTE